MKNLIYLIILFLCACSVEQSSSFKTGSYKLVDSLNNIPTTITFSQDGKLNGKVVNYLMGTYELKDKNTITFGPIASTMMMGPQEAMEAEQNFLQIIPKIKSYKMQGNYLVLITENGGELLFEPSTPEEN